LAEISDDTMALINKLVAGVMTKMRNGDIDGSFAKADAAMIIAERCLYGQRTVALARLQERFKAELGTLALEIVEQDLRERRNRSA
jgi:hypothetical protein